MSAQPLDFHRSGPRRRADADLVPFNIEAEEAVLGSLLLDPSSIALVMGFLAPGDFYRDTHRWIYEAALALAGRRTPIDLITLRDELEQAGRLDAVGGAAYLTSLINCTPSSAYIVHYARIVQRDGERRAHIQAAQAIAELAYAETDPALLRAETLRALTDAQRHTPRGGLIPVGSTFDALTERLATGKHNAIKTGLIDLDRLLGGFEPGAVYVAAARTSLGKTALLLDLSWRIAAQGKRVAYFSLEMSRAQLDVRLLSRAARVSVRDYFGQAVDDATLTRLTGAMGEVSNALSFLVDDTPGMTTADIRAACLRQQLTGGLDFIVVDYLQKLSALPGVRSETKRHEIVGAFAADLTDLATELDAPVLTASQLNRVAESRKDAKPTLADLSEADAIAHHVHVVMLLWRKSYYEPTCLEPNLLECNVAKNRLGSTGLVKLWYDKATNRIENYTGAMP